LKSPNGKLFRRAIKSLRNIQTICFSKVNSQKSKTTFGKLKFKVILKSKFLYLQIIQTVCGKTVSASVVIAMSGIAKVFVGEIVEAALDVQDKWNEVGPLQPKHIREGYRVFKSTNKLCESYKYKKPTMF